MQFKKLPARIWRRLISPPPPTEVFSHQDALGRLRDLGWRPRVVYDIGAYHGYWSSAVKKIFPAAECVMFEANPDNAAILKQSANRYFIAVLGHEDGVERSFFAPNEVVATGASLYRENTVHYTGSGYTTRKVVTSRLDSLVAAQKLDPPDLIKIDVQGAELDVIAGGPDALSHAQALIIETSILNYNRGAPLFGEVVAAVTALGFRCVDFCELHRIGTNFILQLDLLFVREPIYQKYYAAAGLL